MTHLEIRKKFLSFFEKKGHKIVRSSSLLPDDPSVLFTTAGMQQFKPYYTGDADPIKDFQSLNAASIQKSIRTSDIEEIGDENHLTFFEMLGNFSFGGYFKKEAILWAHELIVKKLGLKIDYVSIFGGEGQVSLDKESENIWKSIDPALEIKQFGKIDNFWGPAGDRGPCGPTTEIYVNGVEIWNIVFNEYYCEKDGTLEKLKVPGVDTGMGLERLAVALQNKKHIFETDLLAPLITEIRGKNLYDTEKSQRAERIIADHLRAAAFIIADGIQPSNVEHGYILRRLLRRAIVYAKRLKLPEDFYERIIHVIAHDIYQGVYDEIRKNQQEILVIMERERKKFEKALDKGLEEFEKLYQKYNTEHHKKIMTGSDAFILYSTYGFPIELTEELSKEKGFTVDIEGFRKEMAEHKKKSRAGLEKKFGGHGLLLDTGELKAKDKAELDKVIRLHTATHLLHAALRKVLGTSVGQAGSDITAERLRFDFTYPQNVEKDALQKVENLVNKVIKQDLPVTVKEMPYQEAIEIGALSFFKLKYPPIVKVYSIGPSPFDLTGHPFSRELCGGPHVKHTAEIGRLKIIKEQAVSAGIRRIRATIE